MMYTHVRPIVVCLRLQLSVVQILGIMEKNGERAEEAGEQMERLLFILHTLVSYRDGAKITKPESICQVGCFLSFIKDRDGKLPGTFAVIIDAVRIKQRVIRLWKSYLHIFFISYFQTVLQLTQSSSLSASCSRLLLQITSSLLLGENITLPQSLIQQMIQKVRPRSLEIRLLCVFERFDTWM